MATLIENPSTFTTKVELAPLDLLVRVVVREVAALRRLQQLGVDLRRDRVSVRPSSSRQYAGSESISSSKTLIGSTNEIVLNRRRRRKTWRNRQPSASDVEHAIDGVDNSRRSVLRGILYFLEAAVTVRPRPILHPSNRFQTEPNGVYTGAWR